MYVCICNAVTDHEIASELDDGARNLRDLQQRLGVGTGCGSCNGCVRRLVAEHYQRTEQEAPEPPTVDAPLPA